MISSRKLRAVLLAAVVLVAYYITHSVEARVISPLMCLGVLVVSFIMIPSPNMYRLDRYDGAGPDTADWRTDYWMLVCFLFLTLEGLDVPRNLGIGVVLVIMMEETRRKEVHRLRMRITELEQENQRLGGKKNK